MQQVNKDNRRGKGMGSSKRVVLITGCSTGIGRALAEAYHAGGETVIATARRLESIADLADEGMQVAKLDVCKDDQIRNLVERIGKEHGRLDVLVNNAGYAAIGPLAEMPLAELRRQFETNVFAPLALIQAARPLLRSARGCVVQIGSVSATLTSPFAGAYCASKAALHNLSDALRMELAPFGIRLIIAAPGAIRSSFGDAASRGLGETLIAESWYAPIRTAIDERANASQANPTPAGLLARKIVTESRKSRPRPILRIGNGARLLFLLKRLVPERGLDRILSRKFKLDRLH
jgi:NAD(P)-dependent dehydrogenase (short-subunit alcohol dehydrogenase family)